MKKNKTKRVTLTPKGRQTNSSGATAKSLGTRKTAAAPQKGWHESDIHFDSKGRMVIRNHKLARRILAAAEGEEPLVVITPPLPVRNPHPPGPANAMCGCKLIKLIPDDIRRITQFGKQGKATLGIHS